MAVKTQYPYIDGNGQGHDNLVKHYSDSNKYIMQVETGAKYSEAVDVYPCKYTYVETTEDLPSETNEK